MEKNSAVITGVGPVSAIGTGRNEFWEALTAGRHGFRPITLCYASRSPSKIAAEIPDFRLDRFVTDGDIISRRTTDPPFAWPGPPLPWGDLIMMRRQLLNLKGLCESSGQERSEQGPGP